MDTLTIHFDANTYYLSLTNELKVSISDTSLLDSVSGQAVTVEFSDDGIAIITSPATAFTYASIRFASILDIGLLLSIDSKGFLFIPFGSAQHDLQQQSIEYLRRHRVDFVDSQRAVPAPATGLKVTIVLLSCLLAFLVIFLFCGPKGTDPVFTQEDARPIGIVLQSVEWENRFSPSSRRTKTEHFIHLHASDGNRITIAYPIVSEALFDDLKSLPAGASLHLLLHPYDDNVLAIEYNGITVLDYDASAKKYQQVNNDWYYSVVALMCFLVLAGILVCFDQLRRRKIFSQ